MEQITNHILMIRPANFSFNSQTAVNNAFQVSDGIQDQRALNVQALAEFDSMVNVLKSKGVNVLVVNDTISPVKPDAIFPNNWVSFHEEGAVITYPMFAENRRLERREDIIETISKEFKIENRYSFEFYELEEPAQYLEGTGSLVLDRQYKIAYGCMSPRTSASLVDKFCTLTGMKPCLFSAHDRHGKEIYHTNVMMAVGMDFAVVCLDAIPKDDQRKLVVDKLNQCKKEVIEISFTQMEKFAGNMLEVYGENNTRLLCMSQTAYDSLNENQINALSSRTELVPLSIPTIEKFGGGSVRCMMAEIFLQPKKDNRSMAVNFLNIEQANNIYILTVNRPDALNALNKQVFDELEDFFSTHINKAEVKGVILTGAGEKAFVAGADIKEFSSLNAEEGSALSKRGQDIFFLIERFHAPVIAAVNGFALGGGCELAMACHIRIASNNARFGQPEVNLGLVPGYGGSQRLTALIGKGKSLELLLTGAMITADGALNLGLVNYVTSREDLLTKSVELLQQISSKAPLAVSECIRLIHSPACGTERGFEDEYHTFGKLLITHDAREGATAFTEKRKPLFTGN